MGVTPSDLYVGECVGVNISVSFITYFAVHYIVS